MHIVLSTLLLDDKTFESAFQVAPRNWYFKILFPKHVQLGLRISLVWSLDQQQPYHLEMYLNANLQHLHPAESESLRLRVSS